MFIDNIEELASQNKMSLAAVANACGLSNNAATKWRRGAVPNSKNMKKIADYFGVSVEYLLRDGDKRSAENNSSNISNSAIIQGNTGNHVSATVGQPVQNDINPLEAELLRIFRNLDMRSQTAVLTCAYEQEERQTKK